MNQPDSGPAARYRRIADGFTARAQDEQTRLIAFVGRQP